VRVEASGTPNAELFTVHSPAGCYFLLPWCWRLKRVSFSSAGVPLGTLGDECSVVRAVCCAPKFVLYEQVGGAAETPIYKISPPTCCCGFCADCGAEAESYGRSGLLPFWIFDANQANTNGRDAPHLGRIDGKAFIVTFPENATASQKAMLLGTAIFLKAEIYLA